MENQTSGGLTEVSNWQQKAHEKEFWKTLTEEAKTKSGMYSQEEEDVTHLDLL